VIDLLPQRKFFRAGERRKNARFCSAPPAAQCEAKTNTETNGEKINHDRLHRIFDTATTRQADLFLWSPVLLLPSSNLSWFPAL
jgi:hypothetical protein